jgi:hypothetical protein
LNEHYSGAEIKFIEQKLKNWLASNSTKLTMRNQKLFCNFAEWLKDKFPKVKSESIAAAIAYHITLLEKSNLTQDDIANHFNITLPTVSKNYTRMKRYLPLYEQEKVMTPI